MIGEIGPEGSGEQEGVEPRAETMAGEGAEETLFGAFTVGDYDGSVETRAEVRPEREQGWCVFELFGADAVDFLGGPKNRLVGLEVGDEEVGYSGVEGPSGKTNLDGVIGIALGGTGRFEIDGGEACLADGGHCWLPFRRANVRPTDSPVRPTVPKERTAAPGRPQAESETMPNKTSRRRKIPFIGG